MPKGQATPLFIPTGGVRQDVPLHMVPDDALLDANNVFVHHGRLQTRFGFHVKFPGLPQPNAPVRGLISWWDNNGSIRHVAATSQGWFAGSTTEWFDISDPADLLTGPGTEHVRFAVLQTGSQSILIGANGKDTAKQWDSLLAADYTEVGDSANPGVPLDVTICARQVILANMKIGSTPFPSRIRISSVNDQNDWPATKVSDLTDTTDNIVGVEAISQTAFVVYKQRSQWIARAQPGTTVGFRIEIADLKPGPVSSAAIVPVGNLHYYLGNDNNIYVFDGARAQVVTPAAKAFLDNAHALTPGGSCSRVLPHRI